MLSNKIFIIFCVVSLHLALPGSGHIQDSLRTVSEGNKTVVVHRVDQGETLYSLSRKYRVSVEDLVSENPEVDKSLKIGQEIRVPLKNTGFTQSSTTVKSDGSIHVVQASETLYSISRKYGVTVDQIKSWNNMTDNSLKIGTKLRIQAPASSTAQTPPPQPVISDSGGKVHVVQSSETLYSIARMYKTTPDEIKSLNNLSNNNLSVGQKLVVGTAETTVKKQTEDVSNSTMLPAGATTVSSNKTDKKKSASKKVSAPAASAAVVPPVSHPENTKDAYTDVTKVVEHGLAEVIEDGSETRKYLALHRTAPIGTIMQIRNEMNDQIVFVRVVGAIPATGDNDKILVMISKKAFDRLGAVDNRFPVELSYVP